MMLPNRLAMKAVMLAAMLAAAPAWAEVYKWVDQNGVTNYSNEPPADPATVRKRLAVEDRLSVYTPDPALQDAVRRARERSAADDSRTDAGHGVPAPRVAVVGVPPPPAPADPCDGRADCRTVQAGYYPYLPAVVVPARVRMPRLVPAQLPPGAIAGTVVGPQGFIPGNSAFAPSFTGAMPARRAAARER